MSSLPVSGLIATRAQTYFLPSEVAMHNVESDCWVSVLGKVFDITSLLAANKGTVLLQYSVGRGLVSLCIFCSIYAHLRNSSLAFCSV